MRRDIQVNTSINDIVLHDTNSLAVYPFSWVKEYDTFILGQVELPSNFSNSQLYNEGVRVAIPYTPIYKPIKIQFNKAYGDVSEVLVFNPVAQNLIFDVRTKLYGLQSQLLKASQLYMIGSEDYILQIQNHVVYIWSSISSDLVNVKANIQNRNLLLQCIPSNNYRYPVSGVGLVKYLHANVEQSGLANKLKSEFSADNVSVVTAAFDSSTGELNLDLDFTEVDANV